MWRDLKSGIHNKAALVQPIVERFSDYRVDVPFYGSQRLRIAFKNFGAVDERRLNISIENQPIEGSLVAEGVV
jgi:hypothetical protein